MKTLITGATGLIGSAVVRQLIAAGHDVRTLLKGLELTQPRCESKSFPSFLHFLILLCRCW